jgi:hypothetical protein
MTNQQNHNSRETNPKRTRLTQVIMREAVFGSVWTPAVAMSVRGISMGRVYRDRAFAETQRTMNITMNAVSES